MLLLVLVRPDMYTLTDNAPAWIAEAVPSVTIVTSMTCCVDTVVTAPVILVPMELVIRTNAQPGMNLKPLHRLGLLPVATDTDAIYLGQNVIG